MEERAFHIAYTQENPISALLELLKPNVNEYTWEVVQTLMSRVRWDKKAMLDKTHPMSFILQDLRSLRNKDISLNGKDSNMIALLRYCHFATCISHVWCTQIIKETGQPTVAYLKPESQLCAYSSPNVAVPYLWIHARSDMEVTFESHWFPPGFSIERLFVAVYRRVKGGILKELRLVCQISHPVGNSKQKKEENPPCAMLHLVYHQDDAGSPQFSILKPVGDITFMIFLTRGAKYRFVSCTLNDGLNDRLLAYPVVFHQAMK